MFKLKKLLDLEKLINFFLSLIPISLIAGSLIINLNILIFLIVGIILINKKKLTFQINKINLSLSLFFISIIFSSLINFSIVGQENIIKSILLLRFLILYFVVEILLINNLLNLKRFFIISLACTSFVSIDLFIQYIFGKNILGYEQLGNGVLSGIFYDEAIAGGFIQKLFLFSFLGWIILYDQKKFPKILIIPVVLLHILAVFVSTNRMPFVLIIFSIILLILFYRELKITLIICLILSIFTSTLIAKYDSNLYGRYKVFYAKIFGKEDKGIIKDATTVSKYKKLSKYNFFGQGISSEHGLIYVVAYESFKQNILIGNGLKSIRVNCKKADMPKGKMCLAHPHNFHLEILNDTGLLGYLFITLFVIFTFMSSLKNYKQKSTFVDKSILVFILLNLLIEIWPIKSTGSLFSTWTGSITWLTVVLTSYKIKNSTLK